METVYLLHFERPFGHAKHYLGKSKHLSKRLAHHRNGTGANLMRHVKNAGIDWLCVRTWKGGSELERRLKQSGHSRRCPVCNPNLKVIGIEECVA